MLAEGADAAGVDRSIPLTEEIRDEAFIAYGQNGEPLRPPQQSAEQVDSHVR
jgi:sulfane dehydrogenase subunit SoxC